MTTMSGISSASSAWADMSAQRAKMRDNLFAKVDSDGSGSVDASELQSMLDKLEGAADTSSTSGTDASSSSSTASDLLKKMDTNGDGSLSVDELSAGMRALLGPPPSTMDFAQQRSGDASDSASSVSSDGVSGTSEQGGAGDDLFAKIDSNGDGSIDASELQSFKDKLTQAESTDSSSSTSDSSSSDDASAAEDMLKKLDTDGDGKVSEAEFDAGRPSGVHGHGGHGGLPPPPPGDASSSGDSSSSSSGSTDPLDTNGDGVVSPEERMAGQIDQLIQQLSASSGTNGGAQVSGNEFDSMANELTSAFDSALQSMESGSGSSTTATTSLASVSGNTGSSSSSADSSSGSSDSSAAAASRLASMVMNQYSQFASATSQQSSSWGVSFAA